MSECAQVVPPFRPALLTVTLFFISSLSAPSTTSVALLTAFAALPIQIYSRSFMSPAAAVESLKLSLPRRDKDNSNHAVLDERGVRRCDSRYDLHDDDDGGYDYAYLRRQ